MNSIIKEQNITIPQIEELNIHPQDDIGEFLYKDHKLALQILSGKRATFDLDEEYVEYILKQFQVTSDFIPASQKFMQNVKKKFTEVASNSIIQNFLTWHFIDYPLLTYFKNNEERFDKFKSCAVTEVDNIFVDSLKSMLQCVPEYSIDEIRYFYFVSTIPKLLPHYHYYKTKKSDTEKILDKITETRNGAFEVPIEALYASQLVFQRNFLMRMHVQDILSKRKSLYGAYNYKLNEDHCGNVVYKGFKGQLKQLEKGPIIIKDIKHIDDISNYFNNRENAYDLLSLSDKLKGAYINNTLVGILGALDNSLTNIHVDGDYRFRGVAKSLLENIINELGYLTAIPTGDSLHFIKKVGKYNKKLNTAIITIETLNKVDYEKKDISDLQIVESNENPLDIASEQFKRYLKDNYNNIELSIKNAVLDNFVIGHIIYSKKEKQIAIIEVDPNYRNHGIASKLIDSILDYNIWCADIAQTGILFWFGRGVMDGSKVYLCSSEKRLKQFANKNGLNRKAVPKMYIK